MHRGGGGGEVGSFVPLTGIVWAELTHLKEVSGSGLCWPTPLAWHMCACVSKMML